MKLFLICTMALALVQNTCYAEPDELAAAVVDTADDIETISALDDSDISSLKPGHVTLDFKNADILNVLRILSLKSQVNIVAGPEVTGTVTLRLEDVPWEKALAVVLRTYGYLSERDGSVIRVTTREKVAQEGLITESYVLNYITSAEILSAVSEMLSPRGRIKSVKRANLVLVTDVASNVYAIAEVIRRLDQPTKQAFVDSKIVRTELGKTENLGIKWNLAGGVASGSTRPTTFPFETSSNNPNTTAWPIGSIFDRFLPETAAGTTATGDPLDRRDFPAPGAAVDNGTFSFGTLDFSSYSSVLNLLRSRTNTKVVSNPRIVVLNNQTAKVQVGQEIGIPTFERNEATGSLEIAGYAMRDVGVVMSVTPHINTNNEILVELKPEVSSFDGFTQIGTTNISSPSFSVTEADTQVLILSGETIAIGGLLTDNASATYDKVPIFGSIPVIGKLFRSKRQTAGSGNSKIETLFFITVDVIDSKAQPISLEH